MSLFDDAKAKLDDAVQDGKQWVQEHNMDKDNDGSVKDDANRVADEGLGKVADWADKTGTDLDDKAVDKLKEWKDKIDGDN